MLYIGYHLDVMVSLEQVLQNLRDEKIKIKIGSDLIFNATFSNISAISWRPVLVVEEAGVPGENHQHWTSNW